jgi:hypothetical protein
MQKADDSSIIEAIKDIPEPDPEYEDHKRKYGEF